MDIFVHWGIVVNPFLRNFSFFKFFNVLGKKGLDPPPCPHQNESLLNTLFCCFEFHPRATATHLPPSAIQLALQLPNWCVLVCFVNLLCFGVRIQGLVRFVLGFVKGVKDPPPPPFASVLCFACFGLFCCGFPYEQREPPPPPLLPEDLNKTKTKNDHLPVKQNIGNYPYSILTGSNPPNQYKSMKI